MHNEPRFELDKRLLRQSFEQAAAVYDEAAVLQREVGQRMLERLELIRLNPKIIVEVGCNTGIATIPLMKKYSKATVFALEIAPAMLIMARQRTPWFRKLRCICAEAGALPLADNSGDLLFSNLSLQWYSDLQQIFQEFQRVLKPGGLLMFSTLGPDTLTELRQSWQTVDGYNHVNAFLDMHDVGDILVRAQLADPVLDVEHITLTYKDIMGLMRDLKTLGAQNVTVGRPRGLTGRKRWQAMCVAYERFRRDGLLPATGEVVYGHAWAPQQPRSRTRSNGTVVFPVSQLRQR